MAICYRSPHYFA